MKRAVSISIGSSTRDKSGSVELFGKTIQIERIGTDGDMEKAAQLFRELDGKVDALGVGGAVLGLLVGEEWYDFHSILPLVRAVQKSPVVDGTGLKDTLERQAGAFVLPLLDGMPARVFNMSGVDRYGLAYGFMENGFESVFGDLMFALGLDIPVRSDAALKRLAKMLTPLVTRLPFKWLYPTGEKQTTHTPKFTKYFEWASVIAGDCHYITKYMPERMDGKIVVTNTTTEKDRALFKKAGVQCLVTTTPILEGRSYGTNLMEGAILAALDWKEPVSYATPNGYFKTMCQAVDELELKPNLKEL